MQKHFILLLLVLGLASCIGHEPDFARSLAAPAPAELVLVNGKIVTVDKDFTIRQAVAIQDDVLSNPHGIIIRPDARIVRFFAESDSNFHLHITHDDTARQLLDLIEEVHRKVPFLRQRIVLRRSRRRHA